MLVSWHEGVLAAGTAPVRMVNRVVRGDEAIERFAQCVSVVAQCVSVVAQ